MAIIIDKKITTKYTKIMLTESLYSLALYIYINDNSIDDTLFLLGNNISYKKVTTELSNYLIYDRKDAIPKNKYEMLFLANGFYFGRYYKLRKYMKEANLFFGHDHISLSPMFFSKDLVLIEDGTANYFYEEVKESKKSIVRRFLNLDYLLFNKGYNRKTKKIYLTGILPIPFLLKDKATVVNRVDFIDALRYILSGVFFGNVEIKKDSVLLVTQPLSEDGCISEIEKIKIYKNMVIDDSSLIIKPHPRETTKYENHFKHALVIDPEILVESLFDSTKIKKILTLFSGSIINYPFKKNKKIYIKGTCFSQKILNKYGFYKEFKRDD